MGSLTVAVLCEHDLLAAGLASVLAPHWRVRRVRRTADDLSTADVLVVDVDDPRHAEVIANTTATRVVAWTWHAADGAGTTPSVAVTLPKQADGTTTLAVLDAALGLAAA